MNSVKRTRGIRKVLQAVAGKPVQKFVTAGDSSCRRMMLEARQRRTPGPSDSAILAWARFDLDREILGGYWQYSAA